MTIIVATDFSELAENAVDYAAAIAKIAGARLVLYNSFKLPIHAANSQLSAESFQKLLDENDEMLKNRCIQVSKQYEIEVKFESFFSIIEDGLKQLMEYSNQYG